MSHACHRFWKCYKQLRFCSLLAGWRIPCAFHTKRRFNVQKWREHVVFCTVWLPNFAPQRRALSNISTSKSAPRLTCFVHFDFKMCFAPQQRALFEHRNFQKCSEHGVLCTFWLPKVLRATTACTFSTSNCQKRFGREVLLAFSLPNALRAHGVQLFISHPAKWLRTRRFSEPTFRPSGATNHWKTQCFATFLPFRAPASSFFWLFLFSNLLSSSLLFSSLTLPTSAFSSVHIVGSLTSKFPSIIWYIILYCIWHICLPVLPPCLKRKRLLTFWGHADGGGSLTKGRFFPLLCTVALIAIKICAKSPSPSPLTWLTLRLLRLAKIHEMWTTHVMLLGTALETKPEFQEWCLAPTSVTIAFSTHFDTSRLLINCCQNLPLFEQPFKKSKAVWLLLLLSGCICASLSMARLGRLHHQSI